MPEVNQELANETKALLVNQYKFAEESIEIGFNLQLKDDRQINVDLLVRDKNKKPFMVILICNDKLPVEKLKEILTDSEVTFGVIRQKQEDKIPQFWGWKKQKKLFSSKIAFQAITDYPGPSCLLDNFFSILDFLE